MRIWRRNTNSFCTFDARDNFCSESSTEDAMDDAYFVTDNRGFTGLLLSLNFPALQATSNQSPGLSALGLGDRCSR